MSKVCTPPTDQIDHDLDNLHANLPLRYSDVVQDLYSTDPTQETFPITHYVVYKAPTQQHELDDVDQESICPERTRS